MARPLRIEFPGALYHVTTHGNARYWSSCGPALFDNQSPRDPYG